MRTLASLAVITLFLAAPNVAAGGGSVNDYMDTYSSQAAQALAGQLDYLECNGGGADIVLENVFSPQPNPSSYVCVPGETLAGCVIHESVEVEEDKTLWILVIWNSFKTKASTTVKSVLECNGAIQARVLNYGGAGPRVTQVGVYHQSSPSQSRDNPIPPPQVQASDGCTYVAPLGYCWNYITVDATASITLNGKVTSTSGDVTLCADLKIVNAPAVEAAGILIADSSRQQVCDGVPAPEPSVVR